jgi:hypothetical protein
LYAERVPSLTFEERIELLQLLCVAAAVRTSSSPLEVLLKNPTFTEPFAKVRVGKKRLKHLDRLRGSLIETAGRSRDTRSLDEEGDGNVGVLVEMYDPQRRDDEF